jgi:hypothetical protein
MTRVGSDRAVEPDFQLTRVRLFGGPQQIDVEAGLAGVVKQDRHQQLFTVFQTQPQLSAVRPDYDVQDSPFAQPTNRVGNPAKIKDGGEGHVRVWTGVTNGAER